MVRFLVVGIDPILVFRQEDYELISHWEHKMDPGDEKTAATPGLATEPGAGASPN